MSPVCVLPIVRTFTVFEPNPVHIRILEVVLLENLPSRSVILVLESVMRDGWCVITGHGSSSQGTGTGDGGGSVGSSDQSPVTYFCDHSFSRSMTVSSSGEGDPPVEVSSS